MVLTSDTVNFGVGSTEPMVRENSRTLRQAYEDAAAGLSGKPSLILSYLPLCVPISGDWLIKTLSSVAPGVPIFGTMAVDSTATFEKSEVIFKGDNFSDRCAIILLEGPINPRFFLSSISEEKLMKDKGVVTGCSGNRIISINDMPALQYMVSMGLALDENGAILRPDMFPLVADFNDGSAPILRAMIGSTPEGYVSLAGEVTVGTTLSVSMIDLLEVEQSMQKTLSEISAQTDFDCILLHSCAARYYVAMEKDEDLELNVTRQILDDKGPFFFSYSGGEICPVNWQSGKFVNRLHNFTFVGCIF
jgi:hypothetical protein